MNLHSHAFLVLLASAANEGFRTGRFDPRAPNGDPVNSRTSVLFDAPLGPIPMRVSLSDWRFDEARISVAAWPTEDVDQWVGVFGAKYRAGDVTAFGYLTRPKNGMLLLSNPLDLVVSIRRRRLDAMKALPKPSHAADVLRLYPSYLTYRAAA